MKIPKWIGESYAKLYSKFRANEFKFNEAMEVTGKENRQLRSIFSVMKRNGLLDVLGRDGYERVYKLADPQEVVLISGTGLDLKKIPEIIRPIVRTYIAGIFDRFFGRVVSVLLYGSFARGDFGPDSDIDVLLVIEDYDRSETASVESANRISYKIWKLRNEYHIVTPYALSVDEARYHRPLYLDMTDDAIVLYDGEGFIQGILDEIRKRLGELGARRRYLEDGSWYWDLKPDLVEGEVIEI